MSKSKRTLFVGGIYDEKVTEEILQAAFIPFGDIKSVSIPRDYTKDKNSNSSGYRGYGFVEFEDAEDAADAMDNMDGAELFGRTIEVSIARPMKEYLTSGVWESGEIRDAVEA